MLAPSILLAGRYRLHRPLGQGAIAEVYLAHDQAQGRDVALKIIYPALRDDAVVVRRFRREVEFTRRIQHPHVLAIHDVVEDGGLLFLVMDYHPGGDLADRLATSGALPLPALAALARQLCGALAAAHRAGIVHRDVKASNVLMGIGGDAAEVDVDVRLCDFGLARSAEGSGLTSSAAVLGTPEYMAPEIIADGHADARSDLYSLAVVLYEAATGRLPFRADSPYQMMRLHLDAEPPSASAQRPDLPIAFERALERALAKDPLDRPASADELLAAIESRLTRSAALQKTQPRAGGCPACGGWMVAAAGICADCGHQALRLEREEPGCGVLVIGPGTAGDRIDSRQHVALYRLLDELPPEWRPRGGEGRRLPRLPFFIARQLTQASAERLVTRVGALGLTAEVHRGFAFARKEMRSKASTIAWRYFAAAGAFGWLGQAHHLIPDGVLTGFPKVIAGVLLIASVPSAAAIVISRSMSRPLLSPPVVGAQVGLDARITAALARLTSRQDWRALARISERLLALAAGAGGEAAQALGERTGLIAAGLQAVEEADAAWSAATSAADVARAQDELRRLEQGRVLLRAEFARIDWRLAALASALDERASAGIRADVAVAAAAAASLEIDVAAARELDDFLAHRSSP